MTRANSAQASSRTGAERGSRSLLRSAVRWLIVTDRQFRKTQDLIEASRLRF